MPVPLPSQTTPDRKPPMRAQAAPAPVPFVPLPKSSGGPGLSAEEKPALPMRAQPPTAPIPFVPLPGQRQDTNASEHGGSSMQALGGSSGDSKRIVALLEEIARGPSRQSALESQEPSPIDGPVQWQPTFNGQPMEQDEQGNSILRRRR